MGHVSLRLIIPSSGQRGKNEGKNNDQENDAYNIKLVKYINKKISAPRSAPEDRVFFQSTAFPCTSAGMEQGRKERQR